MKNIRPIMLYIINALKPRVLSEILTNNTAAYIRPAIPRQVSNAPKILLRFIIFIFYNVNYLCLLVGTINNGIAV